MGIGKTMLDTVGKLYPGILSEASTFFDVYRIGAPLNSVFVQTRMANPLSSPALQAALANDKSYQYHMAMTNPFTKESHLGYTSLATVNSSLIPRPVDESVLYMNVTKPFVHTKVQNESKWAGVAQGQLVQVIDDSMFKTPSDVVIKPEMKELLDQLATNLGAKASVMYTQKLVSIGLWGNASTVPIANDPELVNLNAMVSTIDISDMPCIPGYSRVIVIQGLYRGDTVGLVYGGVACHTYVPGPADVDHWCVQVVQSAGGSHYNDSGELTFCMPNAYSIRVTERKIPEICKRKPTKAVNLKWNATTLETMMRSDVAQVTYPDTSGALLIGVPLTNLRVLGTLESSDEVVNVDGVDHVVTIYDVEPIDVEWSLNKSWYGDYLRTGFGVFNPAVSNIQANVLKQWDALEYDVITLRGTIAEYNPNITVSDLHEAKEYRKARAKACKSDDFMSQIAISGTPVTWAEVSTKEKNSRNRQLWMNTIRPVLDFEGSKPYSYNVPVVYEKVDGKFFRKADGTSKVLDLNNEDVQAEIVLDRFYNKGASVLNTTWDELYMVSVEDQAIVKDSDMNFSTAPAISAALTKVGFGSWIDPTGRADVRIMSEEAKYRLHIRNAVEFDKMSAPLWRILTKFTFDTIVTRVK